MLAQLTIALAQGDSAETLRLAAALRASDPAEPRGYSLAVGTLRGLERFDEALALLREAELRFAAEPWFKTRSAEIAALRGDRVRTAPLLAALAALPKAPPAPDRPKVAVILGMHRAGTSLAAKIVARLGYGLGGPLLKPGPDNPDGYQEHQEINARHEELLAQLGMTWDCSWLARPAGEDADHAGPIRERLAAIVREQLEACGGRWAFKDPRTAAFLPLWMDLFDALAVEPIYILAVRAPQDTAASLAKRNGMSAPTAELLWTEHYLTALRRLGPRIACVVHYEDWFAAPERQLRSLSDVLDAPDAIDRAHEVILAGLRHHADAQRPCALPIAEEVAAWLYADAPDFATLQVEAQRLWDRLRGLARA